MLQKTNIPVHAALRRPSEFCTHKPPGSSSGEVLSPLVLLCTWARTHAHALTHVHTHAHAHAGHERPAQTQGSGAEGGRSGMLIWPPHLQPPVSQATV